MPTSHHNHTEPAERTPAITVNRDGKNWKEWPVDLQDQITRIAAHQQSLKTLAVDGKNWSDKDFTAGREEIAKIWPSLRAGLYPWPSQTKTRTKWRTHLEALEQHAKTELLRHESAVAKKLRASSTEQFIKFAEYEAISSAIETATKKVSLRSEERLVVFKARTRGGKTWMGDQLAEEGKINWRVRAMPSWGDSYKAMLISLCAMFNITHSRRQGADELESLLIGHIKTLSGVVLFEEMQGLCRKSQEFIKTLLNESSLVVCIFVTNEAHADMLAHGGNHLAQLLARAETTITASKITADHVRKFDEALWLKADDAKQLDRVAEAANQLGALSAVRRITAMVRALLAKGALITDDMINTAITGYRRAVPVVSTQTRRRGMQITEGRAA